MPVMCVLVTRLNESGSRFARMTHLRRIKPRRRWGTRHPDVVVFPNLSPAHGLARWSRLYSHPSRPTSKAGGDPDSQRSRRMGHPSFRVWLRAGRGALRLLLNIDGDWGDRISGKGYSFSSGSASRSLS